MNSDIFLKFHGFYTRMYSSHYWILKIKFKTLGELYIVMKKNARNTKGKSSLPHGSYSTSRAMTTPP